MYALEHTHTCTHPYIVIKMVENKVLMYNISTMDLLPLLFLLSLYLLLIAHSPIHCTPPAFQKVALISCDLSICISLHPFIIVPLFQYHLSNALSLTYVTLH